MTARPFTVVVVEPRALSWRLLGDSRLLAQGDVAVVGYPDGLLSHLIARWPSARSGHAGTLVVGSPPARIRLAGEWVGEGAHADAEILAADPLRRAALLLLGPRLAHAVAPELGEEPWVEVESLVPIPRRMRDRARRRRRAALRRAEQLRISWRADRPVVIAPLTRLAPSRIERRIDAALELVAELARGDGP